MGDQRRRDPGVLSPRDAVSRYLRRRQSDATERSVDTWHYRLKLFVEWCEGVGIGRIGDLQPYDMDEYYEIRSAEIRPATLEGEMWTLKKFAEYVDQLGATDGLRDSVRIPDIDDDDRVDDTKLRTEAALMLLDHYRDDSSWFGSRQHVVLELAWMTGARQGGLRALDLRDFHDDERFVEFVHRPETGTPLKKKRDGERPVGLPEQTVDAIAWYVEHKRDDVRDEYDRQPLLTTQRGRPTRGTIRNWMYLATQPCNHSECPHGKDRETCEWVHQLRASKCPSSRSPHPVRTGSITYQLNLGFPAAVVAERVNATVETIKQHYDHADREERRQRRRDRMERDRRQYVDQLDFDATDREEDNA